jgi:flagellar FliL protein
MAEEKKKEEAAEENAEAKPKSKKKLFIIIGAVVLLALGGVGFMFLSGGKKPAETERAQDDSEKHYETAEIPTIIVNLSESSSFLKVTMLIEYDTEVLAKISGRSGGEGRGEGGGGEEGVKKGSMPPVLAARAPMIIDAIIRVLSAKKAEQVLTAEGKDQLKEELIEAINEASALPEPAVVNVYFTEFIIQ